MSDLPPPRATLLALLITATAAAQTPRDRFLLVTPQNFDSGGAVSRQFHLNPESYLRMATIERTTGVRALEESPMAELAEFEVDRDGNTVAFADYAGSDPLLDGVIVMHGDRVLFEAYPSMHPWQRHFAWSVTKVLTSTALSALVAEGLISMDRPVDDYLPALRDSAWADTQLRDIANMASGIDCRDSDGYQNTTTCVYRMEESLGITAPSGEPVSFLAHLHDMGRHLAPGTRNEYVSANTNVLMLVMEAVTGQSYADIVRTRIWDRIGAESDALMAISREGHAYASGGLTTRLRDLARFGRVFVAPELADLVTPMLADLRSGGGIALTSETLERREADHPGDLPSRAGWQWDRIWDDGGMFKGGYSGQGLYVDPQRDLVIAWFGTAIDYSATQTPMDSVARQIARSGLFDAVRP